MNSGTAWPFPIMFFVFGTGCLCDLAMEKTIEFTFILFIIYMYYTYGI